MSAEVLRQAAALMRARAEDATPGPWRKHRSASGERIQTDSEDTFIAEAYRRVDMRHIASWHPAVALAVADWLDEVHANLSTYNAMQAKHAVAVARVYLGSES